MTNRKTSDTLDVTRFYAGYDFAASQDIIIRQPTVGDIVEYGESNYYRLVNSLTAIPSDQISELWDNGINFSEISNLRFFYIMTRAVTMDVSSILFANQVDFSAIELGVIGEEEVLYDRKRNVFISEEIYGRIAAFLCQIHGITKEPELPASRLALMAMVDIDRQEKEMLAIEAKGGHKRVLFPLISSMVNSAGYKYTLEETLKLPIFQFMDSVRRISLISSTNQISVGYYTGNFDVKKFKPESALNWNRDMYAKSP